MDTTHPFRTSARQSYLMDSSNMSSKNNGGSEYALTYITKIQATSREDWKSISVSISIEKRNFFRRRKIFIGNSFTHFDKVV